MSTSTDLDATIAALAAAVERDDRSAITASLEAIEAELSTMNPLLRGLTYAHVKSAMGQPGEAVAVVEDLIELMPEHGVVHYQLGCYRRAAGDDPGALAAFTRATELDGSLTDAWINRGLLLDAQGRSQRAVEAFRYAVLQQPSAVDGWRELGNGLAALGLFDQAIEAYQTAEGLRPDDAGVRMRVALAFQAKGELDEANARLYAAGGEALGRVEQVSRAAGDRVLCCRFRAPVDGVEAHREAAERRLEQAGPVAAETADEAFPLAHEGAQLVAHGGQVLLCDVDPTRPGRPDRFFDATRVVARAVAARM